MTPLDPNTRVALVIGGSSGIGAATARQLADIGLRVCITYSTKQESAAGVVADIGRAGHESFARRTDVARVDDIAETFDVVEKAYGGVDVVVYTPCRVVPSSLAELNLDELDAQYATNIRGPFAAIQQTVRRLRDGGSLVTISSGVVRARPPGWGAYIAAKAALEALTLVAAKEVRGRDINVNVVAPGPTATDAFLKSATPERVKLLEGGCLLERLGTPQEVARVVTFLASPEGHWVNAQIIDANGGLR